MEIPTRPRYNLATLAALKAIEYFNITEFPVDVKALIKTEGIKLKKYSTIAKTQGITIEDVCYNLGTDLAYICLGTNERYAIAYNDTKPESMIRFSLAHELGHYSLQHLTDFSETELGYRSYKLTKNKYQVLEREANCFARNLLSPAPISDLLKTKNEHDLMHYFGISHSAATTRIAFQSTDTISTNTVLSDKNSSELTKTTLSHLKRLRRNCKYQHRCGCCKALTFGKNTNFCSVCGSTDLVHIKLENYKIQRVLGGKNMKYKKFELDTDGIAIQCPRCHNEDLENDFCNICGTFTCNTCTGTTDEDLMELRDSAHIPNLTSQGCGQPLDGNSRYCSICGSFSTFYIQGLFTDWQEELEADEELLW